MDIHINLPTQTDEDKALGFSPEIITRKNVIVIPKQYETRQPHRVYDPNSNELLYEGNALCKNHIDRDKIDYNEQDVVHLPGRYVFGGFFRPHFGHFLVECLSHLWAIDSVKGSFNGVLYVPFRGTPFPKPQDQEVFQNICKSRFEALGIDVPVHITNGPVQVDEIIMGTSGFCITPKISSASYFRKFIRTRNAVPLEEDKPEKLDRKIYISRTAIGARKGHILGEAYLERAFLEAGFEIFHPQHHPFEEQLSVYRQAQKIVAIEGSALHLPPFSMSRHCDVTIISRRSHQEKIAENFGLQFEEFASVTPNVSENIVSSWTEKNMNRVMFDDFSVIDFEATYFDLKKMGVLPKGTPQYSPSAVELSNKIRELSRLRKKHLTIFNWDENLAD